MKRGKGGLSQKVTDGGKVNNNGVASSGNNSRFNPRGGRKDLGNGYNDSKVAEDRVNVFGGLEYNQQDPYWDHGLKVGKQIFMSLKLMRSQFEANLNSTRTRYYELSSNSI